MYQPKAIQESFQELVGFLPPNDPNTTSVTGGLLNSDTGIYVSNVHPLCTLDNLFLAGPDFSPSKWPVWSSGSNYAANTVISYSASGNTYQTYSAVNAIMNSTVDPVTAGTGVWAIYNPYQDYVQKQIYNAAASNLIGAVVQRKKLLHMGKAILERQQLYRGLGNSSNLIVNLGSAVGFEIRPASAEGLLIQVDQVGIQSSMAQEELTYYLYHTSRLGAPLQVFHTAIADPNTFDWNALTDINGKPCILGYMGVDSVVEVNTEGAYWFLYFQNDLEGQAVNKSWDCAALPCTCDNANTTMYNKWSRHTRFRNIQIPGSSFDGSRNLLSTNFVSYDTNSNWGMNMSITVRCDLTGTVEYARLQFGDAFSKQLAYEILKVIAYSPRINPGEGGIKQAAQADLDSQIPAAFINDYWNAVETVNLDLSGFSSACMPKENEKSLSWGPGI